MVLQVLKDEQFLPVAKGLLEIATKSIYISTFKAEIISKPRGQKLFDFFSVLANKATSGVDVRFMFNTPENGKHIPPSNAKALKFLTKAKIKVRHLPNDRLCHAKILLVDNTYAIVGSHNLCVRACQYNFELSSYIIDTEYCKDLKTIYENIWDNSRDTIYKYK